jgi:hypothetical protein
MILFLNMTYFFCQVFIPKYTEEELALMQREAEIAEKVGHNEQHGQCCGAGQEYFA